MGLRMSDRLKVGEEARVERASEKMKADLILREKLDDLLEHVDILFEKEGVDERLYMPVVSNLFFGIAVGAFMAETPEDDFEARKAIMHANIDNIVKENRAALVQTDEGGETPRH